LLEAEALPAKQLLALQYAAFSLRSCRLELLRVLLPEGAQAFGADEPGTMPFEADTLTCTDDWGGSPAHKPCPHPSDCERNTPAEPFVTPVTLP